MMVLSRGATSAGPAATAASNEDQNPAPGEENQVLASDDAAGVVNSLVPLAQRD